ncbi:MAG: KH domain-containing protein [Chloroflexota bacterium]
MVEYVARAITRNPDAVEVTEEIKGNRVVIYLRVDEADKGKVIGRDGRVAQAMRAMLRVAAVKSGQRIMLQIE